MKRCPNCLREHDRLGRACSEECELRVRSRRSTATAAYRRCYQRTMAELHRRERHRTTWRKVTMSADPRQLIIQIFGVSPHE